MIIFHNYVSNWLYMSVNHTIIKIFKTRDDIYICAHSHKCFHNKLNVADFQCKYKGKYTLNVDVAVLI